MSFLQPAPPPFDLDDWRRRPYLERLRMNCQDWAVNGFGTPDAVFVLYAVKLALFVAGGLLLVSLTTPGVGGLFAVGDWYAEPVVFQKLAVWLLLWEVLGLGSGSMQLAARYGPIIGGVLYWVRPGTVRLPPWPNRVPGTAGTRRSTLDVLLYVGLLASAVQLLVADPAANGLLEPLEIGVLFAFWAALGLRDKVPFLAARPEIYGFLLAVSLFGAATAVPAWQVVFFCIWWGAAASKLNRHFPFVIAVMISNTPWNRSRRAKAKLYRAHPDDLRPSRLAHALAHGATLVEFGLPLILLLTEGGTLATIALVGMILFHVHITSTFALGVPLEWNLFMVYGLLALFAANGDVPLWAPLGEEPGLIALLVLAGVVVPVLGNLLPEKISFLPSMRYYAGNWATSIWLFRRDTEAEHRLDDRVCTVAPITVRALEKLYGRETAEYFLEKANAFRAMHSHGRALTALLARAVDDVDAYQVREGEVVSGLVAGWNFGDGHFHDERLLAAVQERCSFAPGDVRVVTLESQPAHVQRQRYRIFDAATGLLEEGWIDVAEMVSRNPWLDGSFDVPVTVTGRPAPERLTPA